MPKLDWSPHTAFPELATLLSSDALRNSPDLGFLASPTRAAVLTGGLTNRLYCVEAKRGDVLERWVVRVSGENCDVHFIQRDWEAQNMRLASDHGISPECLFLPEAALLCTRFVEEGKTWTNEVAQRNVGRAAEMVARLHALPVDKYCEHVFDVFAVSAHYHAVSVAHNAPLPADTAALFAKADEVRAVLAAHPLASLPLVPTHNDLLAGNWVEEHGRLWLIDFEYAGRGDRYFDLANFSVNCELRPEHDEALVRAYLAASAAGSNAASGVPVEAHVARVGLLKAVSDLREGLWSFVQWGISSTCPQDFYKEYGDKCLARFRAALESERFGAWMEVTQKTT